jgi:Zn-dependent protease with chaperone function
MKLYLNQNNHQIGPYSLEEARDLIYRGEVTRAVLALPEGTTEWVPLEQLMQKTDKPPAIPPPIMLGLDRLRDPKEKTALIWLFVASVPGWILLVVWTIVSVGILLPILGVVALAILFGELWFAAYVKANAIRVSAKQLPEVFKVVESCCQRIGMPVPDVYIMQQNVWNAFAAKIFGRRMVVLLSGAVDSILLKGNMQQMAWLIGHELGHHYAGHLDFSRKLANVGNWCIWLKLWYSRRCELTCDRIGLFCAGGFKESQLALMNATVGAQLANQVNVSEAINQWQQHRGEFFVRYRTLYSTHPHHLCRLEQLALASSEFGFSR